MYKNIRRKILKIFCFFSIYIILSPYFCKIVYALKIPEEYKQCSVATYEKEDRDDWNVTSLQKKIYDVWVEQGKNADENNWAYLTVGNQKRYLVALGTSFGETGDYVDIYVKEQNKVWPCIMGDTKNIEDANAYIKDDIHWGHDYSGELNAIELMLKDYEKIPPNEFLSKFVPVTEIRNGGSYFKHPDGPVGLDGNYDEANGTTNNFLSECNNFLGAVGAFFRQGWISLCTFLVNERNSRDDATVMYSLRDEIEGGGSSSSTSVGEYSSDILECCRKLTQEMLNRKVIYSLDVDSVLISGDIERCYKESTGICCATYVSLVLYLSRMLKTRTNKRIWISCYK